MAKSKINSIVDATTIETDQMVVRFKSDKLSDHFLEMLWGSAPEETRRHVADAILLAASRSTLFLDEQCKQAIPGMVASASSPVMEQVSNRISKILLESVEALKDGLIANLIKSVVKENETTTEIRRNVNAIIKTEVAQSSVQQQVRDKLAGFVADGDKSHVDTRIEELIVDYVTERVKKTVTDQLIRFHVEAVVSRTITTSYLQEIREMVDVRVAEKMHSLKKQ